MSNAFAQFTGLTPNNFPTNSRALLDPNYEVSIALPASAGAVTSASMDLGDPVAGVPYVTTEIVNVAIVAPALNATQLPNSATATYTIQDSADNSSFAAIGVQAGVGGLATTVQTGAGGVGAAAQTVTYKLPPGTRRYIRVSITTAVSPGDCSAASAVLELVF